MASISSVGKLRCSNRMLEQQEDAIKCTGGHDRAEIPYDKSERIQARAEIMFDLVIRKYDLMIRYIDH